jgi:hypothetical protein
LCGWLVAADMGGDVLGGGMRLDLGGEATTRTRAATLGFEGLEEGGEGSDDAEADEDQGDD